jgi:rare lipoprotein A
VKLSLEFWQGLVVKKEAAFKIKSMKKRRVILILIGILAGGLELGSISEAVVPSAIESAGSPSPRSQTNRPVTAQKRENEKTVRQVPAVLHGTASWYSEKDPFINFRTANGEVFDDSKLTCASWDFSFNTYVKVTNLSNGKSIICRINDHGPVKQLNRLIDLTKETFSRIANLKVGLIQVRVTPVSVQSDIRGNGGS